MSKKIVAVLLLLVLGFGFYFFILYPQDRVLSVESSLLSKKDELIFIDILKDKKKKAIFCDLKLSKEQNREFREEYNRSEQIHIKSFDPKKYEYIFIDREDGKQGFIYDENSSTLKGLFLLDNKKDSSGKRYFYLRSISPKELKILNKI